MDKSSKLQMGAKYARLILNPNYATIIWPLLAVWKGSVAGTRSICVDRVEFWSIFCWLIVFTHLLINWVSKLSSFNQSEGLVWFNWPITDRERDNSPNHTWRLSRVWNSGQYYCHWYQTNHLFIDKNVIWYLTANFWWNFYIKIVSLISGFNVTLVEINSLSIFLNDFHRIQVYYNTCMNLLTYEKWLKFKFNQVIKI